MYAPLVPWIALLALRHRGVMTFTCVNPVIGAGGGVVGESKHRIQSSLTLPEALACALIPPGPPQRRLETLREAMCRGPLPAEYPVVLKPDAGQRGYAVRVARSEDDAQDYLTQMQRPVLAQAYHAGPVEVGVLWVRDPGAASGRVGSVFSVTAKEFPLLKGDGRHSLEQLIRRHPRFRCQAAVFLERLHDRRHEVPPVGETIRLTTIGNHCQGAIFRNGAHLLTPELEAWIDRAATSLTAEPLDGPPLSEGDNGLDFGRFDLRAPSLEDLRAARNLAIIELNGATAESTNIYDPDRSVFWAWGVLFRQWALLYRLGARRRRLGVPPMGPLALRRAWRDFDDARPDLGPAR